MSSLHRRLASRIALPVTLALVAIVLPPTTAQAAAGDVTFAGRGWGHGRGMGQYGALGYAVNFGWSSAQILDHFYGGTVAGNAGNPEMTVELTRVTGRDTVVTGGGLLINSVAAGSVATLIRRTAAGTFQVFTAPGCGGPWTAKAGLLGSGLTISTSGDQGVLGNLVRVCEATGQRAYRGSLSVVSVGATQMTINHVPTETYLRGVVPRESPASWGDMGGGKGMQALSAQAVAARSYALAGTRPSGARTCDTTACQVYGGAGLLTGSSWTMTEDSRTDAAIGATAGVVRFRGGTIARTEFSSSTGGFSAGGAFPAVVDAGDSIVNNLRHTWTTTLPLAVVAAKLGTGTIRTIGVTARNGLGAEGGRATGVRVVSTAGVVHDFSGSAVRLALGLNSDWFSISGFTPSEAQSVVRALYQDLLGRPVDPTGLAGWTALLGRGVGQPALVGSLTRSMEYVQLRVRQAYTDVLGRAADAGGMSSWTRETIAGRIPVDDVQRRLYASNEFRNLSGGTNRGYAAQLYTSILGRPASAAELISNEKSLVRIGRGKVVDGIWFSTEAARHRAGKYYVQFLQRAAEPGGQATWARVLLARGEGAVRIGIAGSAEYRLLALTRFL